MVSHEKYDWEQDGKEPKSALIAVLKTEAIIYNFYYYISILYYYITIIIFLKWSYYIYLDILKSYNCYTLDVLAVSPALHSQNHP